MNDSSLSFSLSLLFFYFASSLRCVACRMKELNIDAINTTYMQRAHERIHHKQLDHKFHTQQFSFNYIDPCAVRVQSIIDFVMRTRVFVTHTLLQLTMINDIFRWFWLTVSRRVMNAHTFNAKDAKHTNKHLTRQMTWIVVIHHHHHCGVQCGRKVTWKAMILAHIEWKHRRSTKTPLNINEN